MADANMRFSHIFYYKIKIFWLYKNGEMMYNIYALLLVLIAQLDRATAF